MNSYFFLKKKWLLENGDPTTYVNIKGVTVYVNKNINARILFEALDSIPFGITVDYTNSHIDTDLSSLELLDVIPFGMAFDVENEKDVTTDIHAAVVMPMYPVTNAIINFQELAVTSRLIPTYAISNTVVYTEDKLVFYNIGVEQPSILTLPTLDALDINWEYNATTGVGLQLNSLAIPTESLRYYDDVDISVDIHVEEIEKIYFSLDAIIEKDYSASLITSFADISQVSVDDLEIDFPLDIDYNFSYVDVNEFTCSIVPNMDDIGAVIGIDLTTIRKFSDLYGLKVSDLTGLTFIQLKYN